MAASARARPGREQPGLDVWRLNDEYAANARSPGIYSRVRGPAAGDRPEYFVHYWHRRRIPYRRFIQAIVPLPRITTGACSIRTLPIDDLRSLPSRSRRSSAGLYTPWSSYRFDALGVEILGSIYERALLQVSSPSLAERQRQGRAQTRSPKGRRRVLHAAVGRRRDSPSARSILSSPAGARAAAEVPRARPSLRVGLVFDRRASSRLIRHFEKYYTNIRPSIERSISATSKASNG